MYLSHTSRAPPRTSWDTLVSRSCRRTETPTMWEWKYVPSSLVKLFSDATCNIYVLSSDHSAQEFPTVISCCWHTVPLRWAWCKGNGNPIKIMLELAEDEVLQSLPSSNPGHSSGNKAPANKDDLQNLLSTTKIAPGQHGASALFCNFRLTFLPIFQTPVLAF